MRSHRGEDGSNAKCLNLKAELPKQVAWLFFGKKGGRLVMRAENFFRSSLALFVFISIILNFWIEPKGYAQKSDLRHYCGWRSL